MSFYIRNLLDRISSNFDLPVGDRDSINKYLYDNLKNNVYIYDDSDLDMLYDFMESINFDIKYLDRLFEISYVIKNSINLKNDNKPMLPKVFYVIEISKFFNSLNLDIYDYPSNDIMLNMTMCRAIYEIIGNRNTLNNEISIVDFANNIYNEFYSHLDKTYSIYKIIKISNMINRAINDLEINDEKIFLSDDIKYLFSMNASVENLYLYDMFKKYYSKFGTKLFCLIKNYEDEYGANEVNSANLMNYLDNKYLEMEKANIEKKNILTNLKKIDFNTNKKINEIFIDLYEKVNLNKNIEDSVKESLINGLNYIQSEYSGKQQEFIDKRLNEFLSNYLYYVNDIIIPNFNKKDNLNELIANIINECKEFFVVQDGKKFKEMIDFFSNETNITVDTMKSEIKSSIEILKKGDIEKLKTINICLIDFTSFVKEKNKEDKLELDLLKEIFKNDPKLLTSNNDIKRVTEFLKGDLDLKDYGYKSSFKIGKDILSYDYLKNLLVNNKEILFNTSIDKIIDNLNNLENVCSLYGINFRKLRFNEDVLDLLINEKVLNSLNNNLKKLEDILNKEDIKKLVEKNPYILCIDDKSLNVIVQRCLLNKNTQYDFYSLLFSELYYYNEDFKKMSTQSKLEREFKYINLDIKTTVHFDAELILASDLIETKKADAIHSAYIKREKDIKTLDELVDSLSENDNVDDILLDVDVINKLYFKLYDKVGNPKIIEKARNILSAKLEEYKTQKKETNEKIKEYSNRMKRENGKNEDLSYSIEGIRNLIEVINDEELKKELSTYVKKTLSVKLKESINLQNELDEKISKSFKIIKELEKKEESLNNIFEYNEDDLNYLDGEEYIDKKYFTIDDLNSKKEEVEEKFEIKDNVIVYANGVTLDDVPNDNNFIDKFYKFLVDPNTSLLSKKFMDDNSTKDIYVEKYKDHRNKIWSRRESRTPVRVYFMPIHTKYFTCYYVIGVNYKDDVHLDGGCSTDTVYTQRIKETKELEKYINSLSEEEAIEFVKKSIENHEKMVKPIVDKYNLNRKSNK